jgi:hypothetical protein
VRGAAAHLVDHVIPPLPMRQWPLSVPKRLRWYLEREPQALSAVLRILLRVIEANLCRSSGASARARFGAVSFIHRFGASLNRHVHYHCCIIDRVFEPVEEANDDPQAVRFCAAAELTPEAVAAITEQAPIRVLRWFAHSRLIERDDIREMLAWENSGFSLGARCAWARTIAPAWSGSCAIVPARRSRSTVWSCSMSSPPTISCPNAGAIVPRR